MPTFTTADGLKLHYTDQGNGIPVLCLAGLTRTGRDFDFVAPHLSGYRVITLDSRGRGQSEWAPDHSTYTVPHEAADALALLDHLKIDKTAILGTSRGGLIAMVLAATARDRLLGVALNDIGPDIDPIGLAVIVDYIGRNPSQQTLAEVAAKRPDLMPDFANVPASRWQEEVERLFIETGDGVKINYDPALRDAVLEMVQQETPDLWPLFDAFDGLPLAAIRGANSNLFSPGTLAEMHRRRPDMIVAEVPDRGHVPFLDEDESLEALHTWLARIA